MTKPESRTLVVARDLIGASIVAASGKRIGHVIDLEIDPRDDFRVIGVELGRFGWLDRFHVLRPIAHNQAGSEPRVVPWTDVDRLEGRRLILKAGAPDPPHG
jgi:sporulation protein YlmC with PRC-barrel domain